MQEEIIKYLEAKILKDQGNAPLHIQLGQACYILGKTDKAINALEKAVELDSYNTGALYLLALAYEKTEQYEKAIKILERKIRAGGDEATSYFSIIRCYCKNKNKDEALRIYKILKEINQEQAEFALKIIADL